MAAPTFVAEYENTSWTASGASKSVSVTTAVGDVLVVIGMCPDQVVTMGTPSGGSLTYTLQQEVNVANYTRVAMWTATATAATTFNVTITRGGSDFMWGMTVLRFSGVSAVGASTKTNVASGAPSLALTTTQANSAIVVANSDWVPVDGSSRTWRTPSGSTAISERSYAHDPSNYTVYAGYHSDAGATGSKTVGLTAPSGQKYSIVALELKGVTGQTVSPSGIASTAAVGSATVTRGAVTVSPGGIASTAAVGSATVTRGAVTVSPTGIASTAAVGGPTVTAGAVTLSPSGIASTAALGNPVVSVSGGPATVAPSGIASTAAVGSPTITTGAVTISPGGIASAEAVGTPTVTPGAVTISPAGIASTAQVSSPVVTAQTLRWRLVNPSRTERQPMFGSFAITVTRESTVFGDESGLFVSTEGDLFEGGGDEDGAIPWDTKYVWAGGHQNVTDDVAIRDLWLAHGFEVESVA